MPTAGQNPALKIAEGDQKPLISYLTDIQPPIDEWRPGV